MRVYTVDLHVICSRRDLGFQTFKLAFCIHVYYNKLHSHAEILGCVVHHQTGFRIGKKNKRTSKDNNGFSTENNRKYDTIEVLHGSHVAWQEQ